MKSSVAVLAALAACTDSPAPDDGLVLDISDVSHVAGTFERDGAKLHFEFSLDGISHQGQYRAADGSHLVSSTLVGGHETMRVLDGQLIIDGPVGSPAPTIEGDPKLLETLAAYPDLALAMDLRTALADHGVADELYNPPEPEQQIADAYWGSDGYYHMGPGEVGRFGTQPFWWPTQVVLRSFSDRCATVKFQVGLAFDTHVVPARGYKFVTGYWWAAWLYITNLNAYVDWSYIGMGVCGPGEIGAFARYGG